MGKEKKINPVSIESQKRLMQIMNDSPTLFKLAGTEWEIKALKPGVQWLIVEEACNIQKKEDASMRDVFLGIAQNFDSVIKIITWALLNDKHKIENDFSTIYDKLKWESDIQEWAMLLQEILSLIDVSFFFATTNAIAMMREVTAQRKKTIQEQKQS